MPPSLLAPHLPTPQPLSTPFHLHPVTLPTSGTVCDRAVITRQILNSAKDPFNRKPLSEADLVPHDELRARIVAFKKEHGLPP